jgi:hypothetical protein
MSKLHEKLAVRLSILGKCQLFIKEVADSFSSKHHLYNNVVVEYTADKEGALPVTEVRGKNPETVQQKLDYVGGALAKAIDVCNQINATNCIARADVIVNGKTILSDLTTSMLLELEKHVGAAKAMLQTAPTLDPMKGFTPDPSQGAGIYKAREIVKDRTAKEKVVLTLAQATDKHPAQVQVYDKDVKVGTTRQNEWSGMLTPAEKAAKLAKIEDFLDGVKEAISRANNIDVVGEKIGEVVANHIFN